MSTPSEEARCVVCNRPAIDHVRLRYVLTAWFAHRFYSTVGTLLGRIEPTTDIDF
jgi:hypothetical protein